jgi:2-alkenal reductase
MEIDMKHSRFTIGLLIGVLLTVGAVSILAMTLPPRFAAKTVVANEPVFASLKTTSIKSSSDQEQALENLYKTASPAVVNITVVISQNAQDPSEGGMAEGSGFLYDTKGRIVTNNHVVDGAEQVEVNFPDGTVEEAKVLGVDPDSDLAVIQVASVPADVQPLSLGDSEAVEVGQSVAAIGNPFGLEGTLTSGIISAKGRVIPSGHSQYSIPQMIQTDAAINPGNSGGPLLNLNGEVIGVNTQIRTDGNVRANTGVGFAVPSNVIAQVVPDLISKGKHDWSWLGVSGGTITGSMAKEVGLEGIKGAYIAEITQGGPAEKAG